MPSHSPKVVLSIAGFDPSSGAGITADIKTIAAHECYAVTCLTAVTVQTTTGVNQVCPEPAERVTATLEALAGDMPIAAVRIGMLGSAAVASAVANFLAGRGLANVVLDPVLRSSSGTPLIDERGLLVLKDGLLPLAAVVTPNIEEAAALTGLAVENQDGMRAAARGLHALGARNVVVTGGHLSPATDILSCMTAEGFKTYEFSGPQLATTSTHGTGCAFASALACNLALGCQIELAVKLAKEYVAGAMAAAYSLGRGRGPLNHLFGMGKTSGM